MKDKTKWAKSLTPAQRAHIIKTWPLSIADMQSGLSAVKFEDRRQNRKAKEDSPAGFSAKGCADKLEGREPTNGS